MGYGVIIRHRDTDIHEFRDKVHEMKKLAMEICEDTESMAEEFGERNGMSYRGGYSERSTYDHRSGYGERGADHYDMQERYRKY